MLRNFFVMMLAALGLMACESEPGETSTGTVTTSSGTGGNTSGGGTNGTGSGTNGGTGGSGTLDQGLLVTVYVPNVATDNTWDGEWVETDGVPVQVFVGHRSNLSDATLWATGESGSVVELEEADFTITVGTLDKQCEANDWLAAYTTDNGWSWIAPSYEIEVTYGDVVELDVYMNAFAEGEWTCVDDYYENMSTRTVEYNRGTVVTLLGSEMTVDGINLLPYDGEESGLFHSSTYATFSYYSSVEGFDIHVECWSGGTGARP